MLTKMERNKKLKCDWTGRVCVRAEGGRWTQGNQQNGRGGFLRILGVCKNLMCVLCFYRTRALNIYIFWRLRLSSQCRFTHLLPKKHHSAPSPNLKLNNAKAKTRPKKHPTQPSLIRDIEEFKVSPASCRWCRALWTFGGAIPRNTVWSCDCIPVWSPTQFIVALLSLNRCFIILFVKFQLLTASLFIFMGVIMGLPGE